MLALIASTVSAVASPSSPIPADLICSDAIVGGGWAGVYFAYRRALASKEPSSICLFEASLRIGGRTYTVPPEQLGSDVFTLDVGAYRFAPDMHLPGDLIMDDLKLQTECYEPSCPSAKKDFPPPFQFNYSEPLRRIINPANHGLPAGYVSALDAMLERLSPLNVQVFLDASLVGIVPPLVDNNVTTLAFAGGKTVRASGAVLLNLPRNKLLQLRTSLTPHVAPRTLKMLECVKFDAPASLFHNLSKSLVSATSLAKAYLYYDDAWWYTKLNTTSGQWPLNAFLPLETSTGVYVGVHWNDGPVLCSKPAASAATDSTGAATRTSFRPRADGADARAAGVKCRGYYAATNETFFYGLSSAPAEPLGIIASPTIRHPYAHAKLEHAHEALLEAIAPLLKTKGVAPTALSPPSQLVVGVWSRPANVPHDHGYTAPTKVYWSPEVSGSPAKACGVDGLDDDEYRTTVLQPLGRHIPIFLANNDWVCQDVQYLFGDWAEEPLLQAERALHRLGTPRPSWLNASYYAAKVLAKA